MPGYRCDFFHVDPMDSDGIPFVVCLCCFVFLICYNCYDMLRNSKMCSIKIVLSRQAHTLLTVSIPSLSADFIIMTSQYGRLIMFDHV